MMQASQYPTQPGMGGPHPGMAHGHPMQVQHAGHMGQPNPGMMPGMHPSMSVPQVTQGGPMASGMPPNPGTPAPGNPMQNAMAIAHLGGQNPIFHTGHPGQQMNMNQIQQMNAQNMMAKQRALNMQLAQNGQLGQGMMNMQGFNQLNPQHIQQMRAMQQNMPMQSQMPHMTPQQQQMAQQQQLQQHQQRLMAQHQQQVMAQRAQAQQQMQQQVASQQMQMSRSQEPATQPPQPQPTPAPQAQPQPQPPPQPPQPQPTPQPQQHTPQPKQQQPPQPPTTQPQPQPQNAPTPQIKQGEDEDVQTKPDMKQAIMIDVAQQNQDFSGQCILQLLSYYDTLAFPARPTEMDYWQEVIAQYYSPMGSIRQQIFNHVRSSDKSWQLHYPSLARFYYNHYRAGVKQISMQSFEHAQEPLPNGGFHVWSKKLFLTYEYQNGVKVTAHGHLNVNFDEMQKIEHLHIAIKSWKELIPRDLAEPQGSPELPRQSPKMTKKSLQKNLQQSLQRQSSIPRSPVEKEWGLPANIISFLEIAEVMTHMGSLMDYVCHNQVSGPREALNRFNAENTHAMNQARHNMNNMNNMNAVAANGQVPFQNQRMVGMNPPNQFQSPAFAHLGLPQNQQSPHMNHTPSPGHGQGGVQMVHQMSAQGSNLSGSQGPSTNTSPNVTSKRRRASQIKEEDTIQAVGGDKTKPSPRVGKRQKGAAA